MVHTVSIGFTGQLVEEGSWGERAREGDAYSTMSLEPACGGGPEYVIVWETSQDDYNEIGIWLGADDVLEDYDGLMNLPYEAIHLLRAAGITVPTDN